MDEGARRPETTGTANPSAPGGLSKLRQVPWWGLGMLSGYAAYAVPFAHEIGSNGEWGWLVVLSIWLTIFPIWLAGAVLLIVLPGRPGTRRRALGIGLLVGPPLVVLYEGALAFGVGFFL